ncbi:transporter substrate-binding domain-containing protein [Streptococcus saliviloxodontae]|uniref:Polar amino acid transport system substrate-binding protein n=1 Tax=Streptococcus saliviloxodontae TaxID=1349416 RepID=A0ABS2PNR3_9STRE|nr:transporter substrate-binding domain-containing protein [Streptococcus saliviloxodontae]MBM7636736.1 polar amino acid transport system substrate-binding protein [Streptococcus saliviloxodontae]
MKRKHLIGLIVAVLVIAGVILAFNKKSDSKSTGDKKIEIVAATAGVSNPFTYKEGNKLTGYDVELLNEIFKDSKEYKLTWETVEFAGILSGLDSDRYTIGANNFSSNAERKEKYLLSDPVVKNPNVIVVRKDSGINSLSDLVGKKAVTEVGNSGATILEQFNKESDSKKIDITYTKEDISSQLLAIESGTYDARIVSKISAETLIKDNGFNDLKIVELSSEETNNLDVNSYYLIAKTDTGKAVQLFINKRLKTLKENGEWEKLSEKFFGANQLPSKD